MQHGNWDDLRVFLAVRREGTLAGAGRRLGVNATTVGRRLSALEDRMEARLFHRRADGFSVTEVGESLIEPAELMERQATLIADRARGVDKRLAGRVRVAVSSEFATYFLIDHLQAFRSRYPEVSVELVASSALADLSRDEADMAVRFVSPGRDIPLAAAGPVEITAQKLGQVGMAVYATRGYLEMRGRPAEADDVESHDLIMPRQIFDGFPASEWFERNEPRGNIVLRVDDIAGLTAACAAGFGLCALPSFMAARYPALQRISPPYNVDTRDVWILEAADLRRIARIRLVRGYLIELFETWGAILGDEPPPA